jgi:hypothetical protein
MEWLAPWFDIVDFGPNCAATFEQVLHGEVAPGHVLHGLPMKAIAKRDSSDDVLFQLVDGSNRVAMVHLTWTKSPPERPPWPVAQIFESREIWSKQCMEPDHSENC